MKTIIPIASLFFLIFICTTNVTSQECKNYHTKACPFAEDDQFNYSGQSRSSGFVKGQVSSFKIVCYEGRDYSFSLCSQKKLGKVKFRLLEDDGSNSVLYDNSSEDYVMQKIFSIETTKKLIVEITAGADEESETTENQGDDKKGVKVQTYGEKYCVGILIEYMKTPSSGF